jgi:hypothetical protein
LSHYSYLADVDKESLSDILEFWRKKTRKLKAMVGRDRDSDSSSQRDLDSSDR